MYKDKNSIYKALHLSVFGIFLACSQAIAQSVNINASIEYQTITGFGGMNGAGWIGDLTASQIETAFGSDEGQLGLSIMRMRIDPNRLSAPISLAPSFWQRHGPLPHT